MPVPTHWRSSGDAQKTVRAAIRGWGPTVRLLTIMIVAAILSVFVGAATVSFWL